MADIAKQLPDEAPSVYSYMDYRIFLLEFYQFRKNSERGYSYRSFAKAAGFTSPNFLKLVTEGQRNLSVQALEKFIKALHLNGNQAEYFRNLVLMNQADNDLEKDAYLKRLKELLPHAKRRELQLHTHTYLSHWIYPVLRDMVSLPDFREDPYWIARRLHDHVSVEEIHRALNFLIKEGFLERDASDSLVPRDNIVSTTDEINNLAIRNYHRQMLRQAEACLDNLPVDLREFGALTFQLPEKALAELKAKLKQFRRDIHEWSLQLDEKDQKKVIAQLNFQLYPHSKNIEEK